MRGISALIGVALALLAIPASAAAAQRVIQKPEERVVLDFGSHIGHRERLLVVYPREGIAVLYAEKGVPYRRHGRASGVTYAVQTTRGPAGAGLDVSFGRHGSIRGSLRIFGRPTHEAEVGPQEGCRGRQAFYRKVRFRGPIRLRADGGYLAVDGESASGSVYRSFELHCKKGDAYHPQRDPSNPFTYLGDPTGHFSNYDDPILASRIESEHRLIELLVKYDAITDLVTFGASVFERQSGDVAAVRWTQASGFPPSTFETGGGHPARHAKLAPPAPFTGKAVFNRGTHSLRGDLSARFAGLRVRLASRDSKAEICDFVVRHRPCR